MPNLTLAIEDTSPLLVYSDEWNPGTSQNDTSIDFYSDGSYMTTSTNAASVFFVFTGTSVGLFGSKRPTHGFYQITVDSTVYTPVNGQSDAPGLFQTSLFSSTILPNTAHTIQLSNTNAGSLVDLDYVTWTAKVGNDDEEIIVNTFQDDDSSFEYTPAAAWSTNPANLGTFSGGSGHVTGSPGSTIQFTFEGDAVSLFGPVGPSGAPYSVAINSGNELPNNYTTNKIFSRPNMMLFHANSLGSGRHTVTLTVLDENFTSGPSTLAIDYAQVYTTPSLGGRALGSNNSGSLTPGAAAGITLGAVLGILALAGLSIWGFFLYIKRRHNRTFFYGFGLDEEPEKDETSARPFPYASVPQGSPPPPNRPPNSRSSYPNNNSALATPSTSQWTPQLGTNELPRPLVNQSSLTNLSTQEIVIPPRGSEKYRPGRAPQLQSPPQSSKQRRAAAALSAVHEEGGGPSGTDLRQDTVSEEPSAPPPEYSQQPLEGGTAQRHSTVPSTSGGSFYMREGFR